MENLNNGIISRLYNAIALMGGKDDILSIIKKWALEGDTEDVYNEIGNWNSQKTDEIKNRLDRQSRVSVNVQQNN